MDTEHFVLVFAHLDDGHIAQLRAVDPRVVIAAVTDRQKGVELAGRGQIMVGWNVPREAIQRAPRLRWIHSTAAGVDQLLFPEVLERDIAVTTSSGIHQPLVEHVFAMMLAMTRRLHVAIRNQQLRKWERRRASGEEIRGKTLGVLGLGRIGAEIAEKAHVFDMRVIGTKRTPDPVPHVDRVLPPSGLPEVLIAGGALGVLEREPLPGDSPLWAMENVLITPHVSGTSPRYMDAAVPLFCENLARFLRGAPLLNLVDKSRGY